MRDMKNAEKLARDAQAAAGWTDKTLIKVMAGYIDDRRGGGDVFAGYLRRQAAEDAEIEVITTVFAPGAFGAVDEVVTDDGKTDE